MIASPDEAFSLLNKWATEGAPITVMFNAGDAGLWVTGRLIEVLRIPPAFQLRGVSGYCLVNLHGASYEYADPHEAPAKVREYSSARFVDSLAVRLPSQNQCVLFHMHEAHPPSEG